MRIRLFCGALLATCALAVSGAQTANAANDEAVWSVAGKEVIRLHGTVGGMTPQQRVDTLDGRLTNILSQESGKLGAEDITLKTDQGEVVIMVRQTLLVTVTRPDAQANDATRAELGKKWLANLRKTLPLLAPRINTHGA